MCETLVGVKSVGPAYPSPSIDGIHAATEITSVASPSMATVWSLGLSWTGSSTYSTRTPGMSPVPASSITTRSKHGWAPVRMSLPTMLDIRLGKPSLNVSRPTGASHSPAGSVPGGSVPSGSVAGGLVGSGGALVAGEGAVTAGAVAVATTGWVVAAMLGVAVGAGDV